MIGSRLIICHRCDNYTNYKGFPIAFIAVKILHNTIVQIVKIKLFPNLMYNILITETLQINHYFQNDSHKILFLRLISFYT
jgi:hypothetical protein